MAPLLFGLSLVAMASAVDWSGVEKVLNSAIADKAFPGCVALVADKSGVLFAKGFGHFTYGAPPPFSGGVNPAVTLETRYDMASVTKVLAGTTAAALLYQWKDLDIQKKVADPSLLGSAFSQNGKGEITVEHLLLHNSGLPPDPYPNYWQKAFGCPQMDLVPPPLDFSCRERIWEGFLAQTMSRPVNTKYVYSDLSMISLMFIIGRVSMDRAYTTAADLQPDCLGSDHPTKAALYQCHYEAFFRKYVAERLGLEKTDFNPPKTVWGECAPAQNNTLFPNRPIQGQVSDGNTYAMGGISAHAGLFSTALDAYRIMHEWMFPSGDFLHPATAKLWIQEKNHTQSSRAYGWNTNDPDAYDSGWDLSCGKLLSPATFMHTGYTGTEVCGDPHFPTGPLITVLLTNRVHPTDSTGSGKMHAARQAFNDAVAKALHPSIKEEWWRK